MHPDSALNTWFSNMQEILETAYLGQTEPWKQSGMSGPADRWAMLRQPIADAIDHAGAFLDIGCANGYLLECCVDWAAERGIAIDPYGLDLSPSLIALAQERLPQYANQFAVGNGYYWQPPRRFDFVRTELVYVPAAYEQAYVTRLLRDFLAPGGRLLIANYAEGDPDPARHLLPGSHPARYIGDRLEELGFKPLGFRDAHHPERGRTRVAILASEE